MKTTYFILSLLVAGLFFNACKKDTICNDPANPSCKNYDPCFDKTPVSADFKIFENVGSIANEADTLWINNPIIFKPINRNNTIYKWVVRTQGLTFKPVMNSQDSMLTIFTSTVLPTIIPSQFYTVTCIATKDIGTCSNLKNIDSVKKVFYLWPNEYGMNGINLRYLPIYGTYAGYKQSNPNQLINVTIFDSLYTAPITTCPNDSDSNGKKNQYNIIRNLAYNNYSSENFSKALGAGSYLKYRGASCFVFSLTGFLYYYNYTLKPGCYGSNYLVDYVGYARLDPDNSKRISIKYTYWDTLSLQPINDYFVGLKIN